MLLCQNSYVSTPGQLFILPGINFKKGLAFSKSTDFYDGHKIQDRWKRPWWICGLFVRVSWKMQENKKIQNFIFVEVPQAKRLSSVNYSVYILSTSPRCLVSWNNYYIYDDHTSVSLAGKFLTISITNSKCKYIHCSINLHH